MSMSADDIFLKSENMALSIGFEGPVALQTTRLDIWPFSSWTDVDGNSLFSGGILVNESCTMYRR